MSSISVSVVIRGDTRIELAESFSVRLSQSGGPNFLVDLLTRSTTVGITDNDGGQCEGTYILIPLASNPIGNTTIYEFIEGLPPLHSPLGSHPSVPLSPCHPLSAPSDCVPIYISHSNPLSVPHFHLLLPPSLSRLCLHTCPAIVHSARRRPNRSQLCPHQPSTQWSV